MWRVFDERAREYDAWYGRHSGEYRRELDALSFDRSETPHPRLEVGVGTGRFAVPLGYDLGVDPALGMLTMAASRGLPVVRSVGEALPFRDRTFGTVMLAFTLPFVDDADAVLHEAHRVLRPDGALVVGTIPADSPLGEIIAGKGGTGGFYDGAAFRTREALLDLVSCAGFLLIGERAAGLEPPDTVALLFRRS